MQTLIVKTAEPQKMDLILQFLNQIEGIEVESLVEEIGTTDTPKRGGILSLVGIWENTENQQHRCGSICKKDS